MSSLFKNLDKRSDSIKVSYLEIYNENVKDLLSTDDNNMMVCENQQGQVQVPGLTRVGIRNFRELISLVKNGNKRRKMAKTNSNQFSSRSHAIIQVNLKISQKDERSYTTSKLSFIDLAGSERVMLTENRGLRMTEGSNINKSLLALGNVINKLSKGNVGYVPYRNSKLTRLLKDSLGGNTKTVLITCITPNLRQIDETIHSLNYAMRAKKIKICLKKNLFEDEVDRCNIFSKGKLRNINIEENDDILALKKKVLFLQNQLKKEKDEKNNVEKNYEQLVFGMEECLKIKNEIKGVKKVKETIEKKITNLEEKLEFLGVDNELGGLIQQQIQVLVRSMEENEALENNLEERLKYIAFERETWLKKGETSINIARSKSPIIHRKSQGNVVVRKKNMILRNNLQKNEKKLDLSEKIKIFENDKENFFNRNNLSGMKRSFIRHNEPIKKKKNMLISKSEIFTRDASKNDYQSRRSQLKRKVLRSANKINLENFELKTEKKQNPISESHSNQDTTYILRSSKKNFGQNFENENFVKKIFDEKKFDSMKKQKSENLHEHYLETVKGANNEERFDLLSSIESKKHFEFSLEIESEQKKMNKTGKLSENQKNGKNEKEYFYIKTEPQRHPRRFKIDLGTVEPEMEQKKENLKKLLKKLNSEKIENFSEKKQLKKSQNEFQPKDFGDVSSQIKMEKQRKANFLNTEKLQMQSLTNNLKLLQDNLNEFRDALKSNSNCVKDIQINPLKLEQSELNTTSECLLPTPLHPSQIEIEEESSPRINKRLERARKKMRNFKKKLGLMNEFLDKYARNALDRGKKEIYQAVRLLIEERLKGNFKLSCGEDEVYERMVRFKDVYEGKWGSLDYGCCMKMKEKVF